MRRLLAILLAGTLGAAFACSTGPASGPEIGRAHV